MGIQPIPSSIVPVDPAALTHTQSKNASASPTKAIHAGQHKAEGTQKVHGTPPAGVSGSVKPAASTKSTNSSSNSTKVLDKRDANQDGAVSYQEELQFSLQHPTEETQSPAAASTNQLQTRLNAYKQGEQATSTTNSLLA